jgi:hypothetical protein
MAARLLLVAFFEDVGSASRMPFENDVITDLYHRREPLVVGCEGHTSGALAAPEAPHPHAGHGAAANLPLQLQRLGERLATASHEDRRALHSRSACRRSLPDAAGGNQRAGAVISGAMSRSWIVFKTETSDSSRRSIVSSTGAASRPMRRGGSVSPSIASPCHVARCQERWAASRRRRSSPGAWACRCPESRSSSRHLAARCRCTPIGADEDSERRLRRPTPMPLGTRRCSACSTRSRASPTRSARSFVCARHRQLMRAHAGRDRRVVFADPGTHPADRNPGAPKAPTGMSSGDGGTVATVTTRTVVSESRGELTSHLQASRASVEPSVASTTRMVMVAPLTRTAPRAAPGVLRVPPSRRDRAPGARPAPPRSRAACDSRRCGRACRSR